MFQVEVYAAVRRYVLLEGHSRREAAGVFGLSRDTIAKMCRFSVPPGYQRTKPPEKPKLGPLTPVIDTIMAADRSAPTKQRHTAKRIFERLRAEYGYAGGYTVVKDYVRLKRVRMKEAFVPLAHPPGHAQVDFGQCIGIIGGVRTVMHVFCFDLPAFRRAVCESLSGGDHGSVSGRPRLGLRLFRRRAAVDSLRQHQAGGGSDPGRRPARPHPRLSPSWSAISCSGTASAGRARAMTRGRWRGW